jgi:hypothetical protein
LPPIEQEILHIDDSFRAPPTESEIQESMPCQFACCGEDNEIINDKEMFKCFLNHPALPVMTNPITMQNIQQHQFQDLLLNQQRAALPWKFPVKQIQKHPVICYQTSENDPPEDWKIALPSALTAPVIGWYHQVLGHCGSTSLYETIRSWFYIPHLKHYCYTYRCTICQTYINRLDPDMGSCLHIMLLSHLGMKSLLI